MAAIYFLAASRTGKVTGEDLQRVIEENEELGHSLHLQSIDALETVKGERVQGTRHAQIFDNGVAIVDLVGPIFPRAGLMTMSAGLSVAQFVQDLVKVEAMPSVTGVIINVDSPGGDVRGIGDAAKVVNALTRQSKKPIRAYASGFMASAAYYIASAVGPNNLISTESGMTGSIGVVLTAKTSGPDSNEIEIVSSQSPYKRADAGTPDGRAIYQQQVDDLAEIFVRDVKTYRKVSQAKVLSDYGQGAVLIGPRALKQGLIDRIDTLASVVEEMASGSMTKRSRPKASDETNVESLLQFTEDDKTMALKDIVNRFRASDKPLVPDADTDDNQGQGATAVGAESENPAVATADPAVEPMAPESPVAADEAVSVDPAVVVQAQLPTREELEDRYSDAAELFATQMTMDNRIFPAQSAHAASDMINARIDDILVGGTIKFVDEQGQLSEGTREAAVRARYQAMPQHTMTQKAVAGIKAGSVAASVLKESDAKADEDNGPLSDERKKALLLSSSQGQAVLSNTATQ